MKCNFTDRRLANCAIFELRRLSPLPCLGPSPSPEGFEELLDLVGEGTEALGVDGVRTGRVLAEAIAGRGIGER